jgi:hypothetical protein
MNAGGWALRGGDNAWFTGLALAASPTCFPPALTGIPSRKNGKWASFIPNYETKRNTKRSCSSPALLFGVSVLLFISAGEEMKREHFVNVVEEALDGFTGIPHWYAN